VILIGRLGADPDIRYSAGGTAVAKFNIATNERVPAGDGNWEEKTEWHRIVVFGKSAENCGNYLSKGRLVCVEGRLQTNQWEDAQGIKRYTTEIVARDVHFLSTPGDRPPQAQSSQPRMNRNTGYDQPPNAYDSPSYPEELPPAPPGEKDSDIPF